MKSPKQPRMTVGIAATLIGTVVGAGFASGQEVFQFFSRFGRAGWGGILLATILLGMAISRVFKIGLQLRTNSYRDFLAHLLGARLLPLADCFYFLFLLLLVGIMFAGSGAVFTMLRLHKGIGIALTGLILIVTLSRGISGMVKVNLCIIPPMFLLCMLVAGSTFGTQNTLPRLLPVSGVWVLPALQFTAYNLVLATPVLLGLAQAYPDPAGLRRGAWLGSVALGLLAGLIHWSILTQATTLESSPLPMVVLAKQVNCVVFWGYSLLVWGEMMTTLLADVYSLAQRLLAWSGWPFRHWVLLLCLVGIAISNCGFVRLITFFYPIYGCLSLMLLLLLFIKNAL